MSAAYKLVVVHPFADYKRGDVIYDQSIINQFNDLNHPNSELISNVVKVQILNSEKQIPISTIDAS